MLVECIQVSIGVRFLHQYDRHQNVLLTDITRGVQSLVEYKNT